MNLEKRGVINNLNYPGRFVTEGTLKSLIVSLVVFILIVISIPGTAASLSDKSINYIFIQKNGHFVDPLVYLKPGDTFRITIKVNEMAEGPEDSIGPVDVYILSLNNYHAGTGGNYYPDDFQPVLSLENITEVTFRWSIPDNETYYVIVDNRDNGKETDTKPIGNVNIDYERVKETKIFYVNKEDSLTICLTTGIIAVVIFGFIITGLISLYSRWRKNHPIEFEEDEEEYKQGYDEIR